MLKSSSLTAVIHPPPLPVKATQRNAKETNPSSTRQKGSILVVVHAEVVVGSDDILIAVAAVAAVGAVSSEATPWDSKAIAVVAHGIADEPGQIEQDVVRPSRGRKGIEERQRGRHARRYGQRGHAYTRYSVV